MQDTNYNRQIARKIRNTEEKMIHHEDRILSHGMLHGGLMLHPHCEHCGLPMVGGKYSWGDFKRDMRGVAKYIAPVSKPIIEALTNKGVEKINGSGLRSRDRTLNGKRHYPVVLDGAGLKGRQRRIMEEANGDLEGGRYSWGDFKHDMRGVAKYIAPVSKPIIQALTNKGVEKINGSGLRGRPRRIMHEEEIHGGSKAGDWFKKTFSKQNIAKVGQIAGIGLTAMGMPEVGVPLGATAKIIGGKLKRKPTARGAIVKRIMQEKGLNLPQASKYVKEHNLY